jgi:hypothetical protein
MADDEVKCPLCKGHATVTREQALHRLESDDFKQTIQGYRHVSLNIPEDAGTEPECELVSASHAQNLTPSRELARNWLGWGRRSPKE